MNENIKQYIQRLHDAEKNTPTESARQNEALMFVIAVLLDLQTALDITTDEYRTVSDALDALPNNYIHTVTIPVYYPE